MPSLLYFISLKYIIISTDAFTYSKMCLFIFQVYREHVRPLPSIYKHQTSLQHASGCADDDT